MTFEQLVALAPLILSIAEGTAILFGFYYFRKQLPLQVIEKVSEAEAVTATAGLSNEQKESKRLENYEKVFTLLVSRDTELLELRKAQQDTQLEMRSLKHQVDRIPDLEKELDAERKLRLAAEDKIRAERIAHDQQLRKERDAHKQAIDALHQSYKQELREQHEAHQREMESVTRRLSDLERRLHPSESPTTKDSPNGNSV